MPRCAFMWSFYYSDNHKVHAPRGRRCYNNRDITCNLKLDNNWGLFENFYNNFHQTTQKWIMDLINKPLSVQVVVFISVIIALYVSHPMCDIHSAVCLIINGLCVVPDRGGKKKELSLSNPISLTFFIRCVHFV